MSIPFNSVSQIGQPAAAGSTGVVASKKTGGNEFGSLLATLFALTAPGQAQGQNGETGQTVANRIHSGQFDLNLLGLTLNGETATPAGAEGKPGDIIGTLLEKLNVALEKLLAASGTAETTTSEPGGEIAKALEALTALLEKVGEAQQSPQAQQAALFPQAAPGETADTDATPQAQRIEAAVVRLQELAGKLAASNPQLAANAEKLIERLNELLPKQPPQVATATAPQTATDGDSAELAANVSQLLGGRPIKPNGDTAQSGSTERDARTAATTQKSDLDLGKSLADIARTGTDAEKSAPRPAHVVGANAMAGAAPAADSSAQPDILLQVQSAAGITTARTDSMAVPKQMTAAYQAPTPNLNLPHIAFEIASQFRQGASHFQVRLDPPEMGKIDVRMDVDKAGNLNARLTVERSETLDLLQRDARALERALSQAGLDGARTNLEFSLKQNPFARQEGQSGHDFGGTDFGDYAEGDDMPADIPAVTIYRGYATPGGVNMLA